MVGPNYVGFINDFAIMSCECVGRVLSRFVCGGFIFLFVLIVSCFSKGMWFWVWKMRGENHVESFHLN